MEQIKNHRSEWIAFLANLQRDIEEEKHEIPDYVSALDMAHSIAELAECLTLLAMSYTTKEVLEELGHFEGV